MEVTKEEFLSDLIIEITKYTAPIIDILSDYYGEDKVDIQYNKTDLITYLTTNSGIDRYYSSHLKKEVEFDSIIEYIHDTATIDILIWFPKLVIRNEFDESHTILDAYVLIPITIYGILKYGTFTLNRSTYTTAEYNVGYVHSHSYTKNYTDIESFNPCCLGNTPIVDTLNSLLSYNLPMWELLCVELQTYLETESIKGGPYIRMSSIVNELTYRISEKLTIKNSDIIHTLKKFNRFLITSYNFTYSYINDEYKIIRNDNNINIIISNLFLKWAEENNMLYSDVMYLLTNAILVECALKEDILYYANTKSVEMENPDMVLFKFKNKEIKLKILIEKNEKTSLILLHPVIIDNLIDTIEYIINIKHNGRNKNNTEKTKKHKYYNLKKFRE